MRSLFSRILPVTMRPTSSRSSTSRVRWPIWRAMMSRVCCRSGDRSGCSCRMLIALRIGASGLRSSCASIARNSFMRRLPCSSSVRRRCSLRSRVTFAKPRSLPCPSITGVSATWAQNTLASLRSRQPWSSAWPSLSARARSLAGRPAWRSSGVKSSEKCRFSTSLAAWPWIAAAPAFQVRMRPCGSSMKIAQSLTDSTSRRNCSSLWRSASSWRLTSLRSRVILA